MISLKGLFHFLNSLKLTLILLVNFLSSCFVMNPEAVEVCDICNYLLNGRKSLPLLFLILSLAAAVGGFMFAAFPLPKYSTNLGRVKARKKRTDFTGYLIREAVI